MSKQTKLKQQNQKRVPAPKQRREPLPIAISVKHHLPISADGSATDLTVAEIEAATRAAQVLQPPLDYSTSQASELPIPGSDRGDLHSDLSSELLSELINRKDLD